MGEGGRRWYQAIADGIPFYIMVGRHNNALRVRFSLSHTKLALGYIWASYQGDRAFPRVRIKRSIRG